jgi:serine/threonine protein kinase
MAPSLLNRRHMPTRLASLPARPSWDLACLGPYKVLGTIAEGGMGIVLRGQDLRSGEMVALKTARSQRTSDATGIRREIAVLGQVSHPGIVRLVADGACGGVPWMAMELLHGETVGDQIATLWPRRRPRLVGGGPRTFQSDDVPTLQARSLGRYGAGVSTGDAAYAPVGAGRLAEAARTIAQLCRALDHLHACGLVHRDVKPANVFVGEDGRTTLLDFGLVCFARGGTPELRAAEVCVGTMEYAAPEQIRGEPVDARADIYSVGCVLYELMTGRRLADADACDTIGMGRRPFHPVAPSKIVTGVPRHLEALLLAMLSERREARPSAAGSIAATLEDIACAPDAAA